MPFLYTFCSWFSVRTGSIIVAIASIVQALIFILLAYIGIQKHTIIAYLIGMILKENDMLFTEPYMVYLEKNTEFVFTVILVSQIAYIVSCILLIHGSIKLQIPEILPYTIIEFIRLTILSSLCITLMLLIKKNVLDFNVLIACLVSGGFVLLFLYYLWLCPVSLVQCILRVKKKNNNNSVPVLPFINNEKNISFYIDYLSDFKFKPMMPNREYYQYQYGNLPKLHF